MENLEAKALLEKYSNNSCTEEELALLESWYNKHELEDITKLSPADWSTIDETSAPEVKKQVKLWPGFAAAAILIIVAAGIYFTQSKSTGSAAAYVTDIAPGGNRATLTLADGKIILLSDAKTGIVINDAGLKYNDNTTVRPLELLGRNIENTEGETEFITASTPRGGIYQVTLPDKTKVWLNAASKISFPIKFSGGVRKVMLSGEAYFEVTKDKQHPFVVESKGQRVTVLGTHFNINAYEDEGNIKTTLLEGSVKVNEIVIKPDQQATVTGTSGVIVKEVESNDVVDWKNGIFVFKGETIESIMRKVSRWYDVDVIYEPGVRKDLLFGGYVSRTLKISSVLRIMERTGKVKFKIVDNRVYVKN